MKIHHLSIAMIAAIILMAAFLFSFVQAQTPQAIPYQGAARDNSGNAITNQSISLRFSIHDATASGTIVYKETQGVTTTSLGLFTVNIGQGTVVTGTFSSINWSTNSKFLQVEMDAAGGTNYVDMGTTQMLSVPYALSSADNQWTKTGSNISNSNSGNVGIGTTSPSQKLEVSGSTKTINLQMTSGANTGYVLKSDASGNASWVNPTSLANGSWTISGSDQYSVVSGNVGIGTTSPVSKLHVYNSSSNTVLRVESGSSDVGIKLVAGGSGKEASTSMNTGSSQRWSYGKSNTVESGSNTGSDFFINSFDDNGSFISQPFVIKRSTGNVGIGTSAPTQKLEVSGKTKTTSFQMTNGATANYVLASDASGNASWKDEDSLHVSQSSAASSTQVTVPAFSNSTSNLTISGVSATVNANTIINLTVNLSATDLSGLGILLISPNGSAVFLFQAFQLTGSNLTNTIFSSEAAASITTGTAPYTGTFLPNDGSFSNAYGSNSSGTWQLKVFNGSSSSVTLLNWSLSITGGVEYDNLGNHTASQNIQLNDFWLSNDSGDEGLKIDDGGSIYTSNGLAVGTSSVVNKLDVEGNVSIGSNYSGSLAAPTNGAIIEGNVGIGTSSPSGVLHTIASGAKTTAFSGNLFTNTATSSTSSITKAGVEIKSTGSWTGTSANNIGLYVSSVTGGTNNYDAVFNGGGNVGIGTLSPTAILQTVASGAKTAAYSGNLLTNTATSSTSSINKAGVEIQSTGSWSGTSAKNIGLYVSSVTGGTNNYDAIFNGGGNVGIGTTSPAAKLEVNGTVKVGSNGSALNQIIRVTLPLDVPSVAANSSLSQTFAIANTTIQSAVAVSPLAALPDGLVIAYAHVSSAGTIEVSFRNTTGAAIDPASTFYYIMVMN